MFSKLFHNKKGGWLRSISLQGVVGFLALSLIATFIINYLLNQIFDVKMLSYGTPVRIFIFLISLTLVFWIFFNNYGRLDKKDIITIIVIGVCSGLLILYLPTLIPELYQFSAYSNPDSPVAVWYDAASGIKDLAMSII